MKEFKVLKFIDKFKWVFIKMGINYEIMRKILQVKLMMDGRRVPTILSNSKGKKDDDNRFFKSLWMYALLGLLLVVFVMPEFNIMFQMSIFFGILMFMIITTFISDFSSVLLDIRDKNIMFSKPVDSKTINTAKIIHVLIYMFYITISMTGLSLIVSLRHGFMFFIILLLEIILVDLFMVVLTALLYCFVLKFFDGEKLKDIINYVQIALSIVITIGYQLIGRLFDFMDLGVVFTPKWWQYLIPPIWFAAPLNIIYSNEYNSYFIIFSVLAVFVPIISILIYIKLIPTFESNLQKLNNNSAKFNKNKIKKVEKSARIFCANKEERVFFKFAYNMLKNEREFKLKVYPSIGLSLVFPFIFMFRSFTEVSSLSEWLNYMPSTKYYLNIYFCAMMIPTIVMMMKYSGKYKGAWIYKAMPIRKTASVFTGTLKAFIVKLILPVYLFQAIVFMIIFGMKVLPDLVAVFLTLILVTIVSFKSMKKSLPFSKSFQVTQESQGGIVFALMLLLAILVGIHFGCTFIKFGVYLYIIVIFILNVILWRKSFEISWEKIID